jgi:hypothetical protein
MRRPLLLHCIPLHSINTHGFLDILHNSKFFTLTSPSSLDHPWAPNGESSDASTPPSSPPLSLPPLASLAEGSSQGPLSSMCEHGEPSEGFLLEDLDSEG